jgi:hypothetical protein
LTASSTEDVSEESVASASGTTCTVSFNLKFHAEFGQSLKIIGSCPALGKRHCVSALYLLRTELVLEKELLVLNEGWLQAPGTSRTPPPCFGVRTMCGRPRLRWTNQAC